MLLCFLYVSGYGEVLTLRVTVGDQSVTNTNNQPVAYAPPTIASVTAVSGAPFPTTALNTKVRFIGTNLGPSMLQLQYDTTVASGETVRWSMASCDSVDAEHKSMECPLLPGIGTNMQFFACVHGRCSTVLGSSLSYQAPEFDSSGAIVATLLNTAGGTDVTLVGKNFGQCREARDNSEMTGECVRGASYNMNAVTVLYLTVPSLLVCLCCLVCLRSGGSLFYYYSRLRRSLRPHRQYV